MNKQTTSSITIQNNGTSNTLRSLLIQSFEVNANSSFFGTISEKPIPDIKYKHPKKKLNTNLDAKKTKELNKLRDKLRISIKDLSKTEIRRRERLNERIKTKQNGYGPITETNRFFRQTSKTNEHLKEKSNILCITEKPNQIEEREEFVSGLITQDQNFFSSHLNEYQKFLNVLKDNTKNGRNIKIEKNGLDGPSNFFLTEKFHLKKRRKKFK